MAEEIKSKVSELVQPRLEKEREVGFYSAGQEMEKIEQEAVDLLRLFFSWVSLEAERIEPTLIAQKESGISKKRRIESEKELASKKFKDGEEEKIVTPLSFQTNCQASIPSLTPVQLLRIRKNKLLALARRKLKTKRRSPLFY